VREEDSDDEDEDDAENKDRKVECATKFPCPILEFRLVNTMSTITGGEIMDACVSVVATTVKDEDDNGNADD